MSLEDVGLGLVQTWPPFRSDVKHGSQSPDASTVLGHLLTKGQKQEALEYLRTFDAVQMAYAYTCDHMCRTKGQGESESSRKGFAVDSVTRVCSLMGVFLYSSEKEE